MCLSPFLSGTRRRAPHAVDRHLTKLLENHGRSRLIALLGVIALLSTLPARAHASGFVAAITYPTVRQSASGNAG